MKALLNMKLFGRLRKAGTFSPEAFLVRAFLMSILFATSHLLGLKEYTTFLSGTSGNPNVSLETASLLGCIHLLFYVGFILLVPVSLITAGLLAAWNHWKDRHERD